MEGKRRDLHLLVNCANLTASEANSSSKSNNSSEGGGSSLMEGRKMAGCNCGNGVSNCHSKVHEWTL